MCSPGSAPPLIIAVVAAASLPPATQLRGPGLASRPPSPPGFLDAVETGHGTRRPRSRSSSTRRWTPRRSPRAADHARRPVSVSWDAAGRAPDDRPDGALAPGHALHASRSTAARAPRPAAARRPGAQRRPDRAPRARASIAATRTLGDRVRADTSFPITPRPGRPARGRPRGAPLDTRARRRPAAGRRVRRVPSSRRASTLGARRDLPHLARRARRRRRRPVRRRSRRSTCRPAGRRRSSASGRSAATAQVERTAILSVRFTAADGARRRPRPRSSSSRRQAASPARSRWAEDGTVLVFTPSRPLAVRREASR